MRRIYSYLLEFEEKCCLFQTFSRLQHLGLSYGQQVTIDSRYGVRRKLPSFVVCIYFRKNSDESCETGSQFSLSSFHILHDLFRGRFEGAIEVTDSMEIVEGMFSSPGQNLKELNAIRPNRIFRRERILSSGLIVRADGTFFQVFLVHEI